MAPRWNRHDLMWNSEPNLRKGCFKLTPDRLSIGLTNQGFDSKG